MLGLSPQEGDPRWGPVPSGGRLTGGSTVCHSHSSKQSWAQMEAEEQVGW